MNFDLTNSTPEEKAIIKQKCLNDLLFFTRFFFKILRGNKFIVNWHHKEICKELEKAANYEYELLNINIPPRHSKTELAGINFIAWSLANNPKANFLYITASDELRSETSVRIRDIITNPAYKELFGIELKKDQSAKNLWRTNHGGGLKTATIFGQITGFGAGRMVNETVDYIKLFEGSIVLDDINKIMDALADTANNQKANDIILTTILSRKNSPETPIINIQQRAGLNDATFTLNEFYSNSKKAKNLVIPILKGNIPLWDFICNLENINRLRTHHKTKYIFNCQYMQAPTVIEGALFQELNLKRFSLNEFNYNNVECRIGVIDVADEGKDYFSFPIFYTINKKHYLVDVVYTSDNIDITQPISLQKSSDHKLEYISIETNNQGKEYYRFMKRGLQQTSIRGVWSVQNKETRILMQSGWIVENCYFRNDYEIDSPYDIFMKDLTKYLKMVKGQRDDAPDSLAAFAIFYKKIFGII